LQHGSNSRRLLNGAFAAHVGRTTNLNGGANAELGQKAWPNFFLRSRWAKKPVGHDSDGVTLALIIANEHRAELEQS
jgi:hypothetical protein